MAGTEITFIHTADCHLDAPLTGLRFGDPATAERVTAGQRNTFVAIADLCIRHRADFLVIAGDLFDTSRKNLNTQIVLKEQFGRLDRLGIKVFIAAGNHDNLEEAGYGEAGLEITLPKNVHVFSGESPEEIVIEKDGAPAARVVGMSFPKRDVQTNLANLFPDKKDRLFTVGVLHTSVGGAVSEHDTYAPCATGDLERRGYDYWALGHIHKRGVLRENPYIVYPGCPQARRRRETGGMSVTLVRANAGGISVSELPTGALQMEDVAVDITGIREGGHGDLAHAIKSELDALRARLAPHVECCIVRIRLTGEGPLFNIKYGLLIEGKSAKEYIIDTLAQLDQGKTPSIIIRELDAEACAPEKESLDIAALRNEDSVMGEVVRFFDSLSENPAAAAEFSASLLENALGTTYANDKRVARQLQRLGKESGEPGIDQALLGDAMMICLDALRPETK